MITGRLSLSAWLPPRGVALAALASIACMPGVGHAASGVAPQRSPSSGAPAAQALGSSEADPSPRDTTARARMLECGHQWNNMKRAGTASGTWKDFSRGCLAQR